MTANVARTPSLRALRRLSAAVMLSGCGATYIGADLAPDPHGWEGQGRVIRHAALPLSRELSRGLDLATRGEVYFGAIHVNPQTDRYYYARNWNSLAAALDVTRAECEAASARGECILLATVAPARLAQPQASAEGFSVSTLDRFRLIYRFQHDRRGQWGAFARSSLASSGIALDQPDRTSAEALALANCAAAVAAEIDRFSTAGQRQARAKGYDRCRIVDVAGPVRPPRS